eukprot:TRINITY_DN46464_c0_g1_i2.p1 TRINITY_DN46464_c0_g1~~TRINITY_DN46464_c0_g1_i2.p1  ORF type:complete len:461 (+),score=87.83 TRINITY_DN46464_c0_g1_i2:98-1480(+)
MVAAAKETGWKGEMTVWRHPEFVHPFKIKRKPLTKLEMEFANPTSKIARHYWLAFENTFAKWEFAVFMEEDLLAAPDFVAFFRSVLPVLHADRSVRCVSAWNDYGFAPHSTDPCRLFRTSWFPGLGFLLTRSTWLAVREHWPMPHGSAQMGWDYWMRVRFWQAGWECIVPEVPRISHAAGQGGSSVSSEFQKQLLDKLTVSDGSILDRAECPSEGPLERCWAFGDLSYLLHAAYETHLYNLISSSQQLDHQKAVESLKSARESQAVYTLTYEMEMWAASHVTPSILGTALAAELVPQILPTGSLMLEDMRMDLFGLLILRHIRSQAILVLIDRRAPSSQRFASALRPHSLAQADPAVQIVPAARAGLSCEQVCASKQLHCSMDELAFLMARCDLLAEFLPCERGCQVADGGELPAYVSTNGAEGTDMQCLIDAKRRKPSCTAAHPSTVRLCACMPEVQQT